MEVKILTQGPEFIREARAVLREGDNAVALVVSDEKSEGKYLGSGPNEVIHYIEIGWNHVLRRLGPYHYDPALCVCEAAGIDNITCMVNCPRTCHNRRIRRVFQNLALRLRDNKKRHQRRQRRHKTSPV